MAMTVNNFVIDPISYKVFSLFGISCSRFANPYPLLNKMLLFSLIKTLPEKPFSVCFATKELIASILFVVISRSLLIPQVADNQVNLLIIS